jgi:hypothetical protein
MMPEDCGEREKGTGESAKGFLSDAVLNRSTHG